MSTADKVLSVLSLFSIERPEWTVEAIADELDLSGTTTYKYVRSLVAAGLLVPTRGGNYSVGPAVIELDRITRRFDPLIGAARPALEKLTSDIGIEAIGLLCRIYQLQVICIDQVVLRPPSFAISYERGRPMNLTRGSASKVILANLTSRPLHKFYELEAEEIREAGLGNDWDEFKRAIRKLRRYPVTTTYGELDPGVVGICAPVFGIDGTVLGSIGLVVSQARLAEHPGMQEAATAAVIEAGKEVTRNLQSI
nr:MULTISPECIES: IclR family transcriptional regulator C-terminal domain-containing protein [unclassified Pseudomonas]